MNVEWVGTLWSFLAQILFVGLSLLSFSAIIALAIWKLSDLYLCINVHKKKVSE